MINVNIMTPVSQSGQTSCFPGRWLHKWLNYYYI